MMDASTAGRPFKTLLQVCCGATVRSKTQLRGCCRATKLSDPKGCSKRAAEPPSAQKRLLQACCRTTERSECLLQVCCRAMGRLKRQLQACCSATLCSKLAVAPLLLQACCSATLACFSATLGSKSLFKSHRLGFSCFRNTAL